MSESRIAVTGMGMVTALGWSLEDNWRALQSHRGGLGELTLFDSPRCGRFPVAQVEGGPTVGEGPKNDSRTSHFAVHAARCAFNDANLESLTEAGRGEVGAVLGVCTGGMLNTEYFLTKVLKDNILDASLLRSHSCSNSVNTIADLLRIGGLRSTVSSACVSGTEAITIACDMLSTGQADIVLAGGADSLTRLTINGFCSLLVVAPDGCRPFDANRKGMSLGEGAGVLVLETEESALGRDADIYAYITGWANTCDAFHETSPSPNGDGINRAMSKALEMAQIQPSDVDYINAHGSGTIDNDKAESQAIMRLFEGNIPLVSSTKRFFGHTLAAAGAIEAIVCILALKYQCVPANLGLRNVDPEVAFTPIKQTTKAKVNVALSNSVGFGGNNSTVVLTCS